MNGITILNSYTDPSFYNNFISIVCILFIVGFVLFFIAILSDKIFLFYLSIFLLIGSVIYAIIGGIILKSNKEENAHLIYEVTIDDEVSFSKFMEKYDILDVEGKIYTIREKEEN